LALEYNLQVELEVGVRQVRVVDGMCRVNHIALGCSVIRRDAFESLVAAGIAQLRPDWFLQKSGLAGAQITSFLGVLNPQPRAPNLFARMQSPLNEVLLSTILAQPGKLR
jgi:hypothetical protein